MIFPGYDLEGIAIIKESSSLMILEEKGPSILILDSSWGIREIIDPRRLADKNTPFFKNVNGFEGLEYDYYGIFGKPGSILLTNQVLGNRQNEIAHSGLLIIDLTLKTSSFLGTSIYDCSDLSLDPYGRGIWVLSDKFDTLFLIDRYGAKIGAWGLPKGMQEGLSWGPIGIFILDEDGTIIVGNP